MGVMSGSTAKSDRKNREALVQHAGAINACVQAINALGARVEALEMSLRPAHRKRHREYLEQAIRRGVDGDR
jgi:hypothetical protein